MSTFFYLHGDALGTAFVLIGLLVFALYRADRSAAAQRKVFAMRLEIAEAETDRVREQHRKACLATFEHAVAQAEQLTRIVHTPLSDSYLTVADVPSPFAPVFYSGGVR